MSTGKVSTARRELEELGYLNIQPRTNDTDLITLVDRMAENVARYSPHEHRVHHMNTVFTTRTPCSPHEHRVHQVKQRRTKEEEPKKKNHSDADASKQQTIYGIAVSLIEAFGLDMSAMTKSAHGIYFGTARELHAAGFRAEQVPALYRFVQSKASSEDWRGFTVKALAKYAPEFAAAHKPAAAPVDDLPPDGTLIERTNGRRYIVDRGIVDATAQPTELGKQAQALIADLLAQMDGK